MYSHLVVAGLVLLTALPALAQQQPVVLTFEAALARARQSAPILMAARLRVEEARGRAAGASRRLSTNPTVELEGGRRSGELSSTDYGVAMAQELDLPSRRRARIDAAQAGVAQEEQRVREVERAGLRAVAVAFLRAVEARERADAASGGQRLADEALRIAERRYEAGDVAQLDVNLARTAVARAEAESCMGLAMLSGHATHLQILLGLPEPVTVEGSLREAIAPVDPLGHVADRPDVRVLDAEIAQAEAEQRMARTLRWPDLGVRGSYSREEGDTVVMAGVGVSLPIFNRGQEALAVANARLTRLRAERMVLTQTVDAEVRGAQASYDALRSAAAEYERVVLPLVEQNERLALESYDAGQIGLGDLLLVRREALDARRALIDQLIETRLAEVDLRASAGVWK